MRPGVNGRRKTTINRTIASSIAPIEKFDKKKAIARFKRLGVYRSNKLYCIYCRNSANTWDHLYNLTENGKTSGYGHTLSNFVPACSNCNSERGRKRWDIFMLSKSKNKRKTILIIRRIKKYKIRRKRIPKNKSTEYDKIMKIQRKIHKLLDDADKIAEKIRD